MNDFASFTCIIRAMKESLLTDIFGHVGLFLVIAALLIPLLRFCKIPSALGYLLFGIILGPYALGAITADFPLLSHIALHETTQLEMLSELGIILLLFVIGLEITPSRLWQMRHLVFGLGGAQVAVTSIIIGSIAYLWGNNIQVSVLLGLGLALSSTAIIMQWIQENKLFSTAMGRSSFSILLFQDLAVVPILLLITIMSSQAEGGMIQYVSLSFIKMVATVAAIFFVGKFLLRPIFAFASKHGGKEVFVALILLVIVSSASAASLAGLSMAFGAFIAGLLLADTEYKHEIYSLIMPFKSMLLGIFFLSFGLGINLLFIAQNPLWILASVMGLLSLKAFIIFCLCKLWRQNTAVAAESGLLLSQSGEFGLLVVGSSLTVGLMTQDVGQFMLIVVAATMMVAPIMAPLAHKIGLFLEEKFHKDQDYHSDNTGEYEGHIVIFGYGRVGKDIGNDLCQQGYQILAFDKNAEKTQEARKDKVPVFMGDVTQESILTSSNIEKARCAVITLDNAQETKKLLDNIYKKNKSIPIIIRAHSVEDRKMFDEFDTVEAIAENDLISKEMSNKILNKI